MSLKAEQRLENMQFTEFSPRIYTSGAFLVPMEVKVGNITRWVWVVDEFHGDSYHDGECVMTNLISDKLENLLIEEEVDLAE